MTAPDHTVHIIDGKKLTPPFFVFFQAVVNLMRKLKDIIKESYALRDFVPLNLFKLDNRHLKGAIVMLTDRIYDFIIDFYNAANINENRA